MAKGKKVPAAAKAAKPSTPYRKPAGPAIPAGFYPQPPEVMQQGQNPWSASDIEAQRRGMQERAQASRARGAAKIASIKRGKALGRGVKIAGLGALAALGTSLAARKAMEMGGVTSDQLINKALYDMMGDARQSNIAGLVEQAKRETYEDAIQQNLARIQQHAPDLYMSVAAGRRLPSGAVVLGGAPRQDLLNELGRSMADGRFSQ